MLWAKYDRNYVNALDKNEMSEFLVEYCREQEVTLPSMIRYSTFFNEFQKIKEGLIQKREMARFLKQLLDPNIQLPTGQQPKRNHEWIKAHVDKAWYCYDINRTGFLDRHETFDLLKSFLTENGLPQVTQNKFYDEFYNFNSNGERFISENDMPLFFRIFVSPQTEAPQGLNGDNLDDLTLQLFEKHDTNWNGYLERDETLRLINELCSIKNQPLPTMPEFNRLFSRIDLNQNGLISKFEMKNFVKQFIDL